MQSHEIRRRFLEFFRKRGHTVIPSASLVPQDDSSVLFTIAGMQPLMPYLLGAPHPAGRRLVNVQKCVRTQDIEEVGDATHDTFFEMLGNWSLGDYFKKEAITWSYELLTSRDEGFGLDPERLYVTVFSGNKDVDSDEESKSIWISLGIPEHRIYYRDKKDNWWPAVKEKDTWTGPTGPSTEMFYDVTEDGLGDMTPDEFRRADDEQKIVEIWNDVFMTHEKQDGKIVGRLESKNVDTGAGLERLAMALQKKDNIFDTDLFKPLVTKIRENTGSEDVKAIRIIADHIRSAVFLIVDGVIPSNTDRGYVLRRLLRRARYYYSSIDTHAKTAKGEVVHATTLSGLASCVAEIYEGTDYKIAQKLGDIGKVIALEETKFLASLESGKKQAEKIMQGLREGKVISGKDAFTLFSTFGYPRELIVEIAQENNKRVDIAGFEKEMKKHQNVSRKGAEGRFGGGLADHRPETLRLHTATHLLQAALRAVLGAHVLQKGSNITRERLRFDFSHPKKLAPEELAAVEDFVNKQIARGLEMRREVMTAREAKQSGTIGLFDDVYARVGGKVSVYSAVDPRDGTVVSREICGGPHVPNTRDVGRIKITKEEAVGSGIRRIRAVLVL